ncbi:MAG: hypothetical protein RL698_2765 [Pseudomonadota bacterium]|jgi:DNA-binding NtrC family response regulator
MPATRPQDKSPVLFVDDEPDMIATFVNNFEDVYEVLTATDGPGALAVLERMNVPVMVTDQRMPGMPGLEVIRRGLALRPDMVPIILTGFTNDRDLIEAINLQRVHRYIPKPWDAGELRHSIDGALERARLATDNRLLAEQLRVANERLRVENAYLKAADVPRTLIGESTGIRRLLDEVARVAPRNVTVLIEGETGTGKELVARAIHGASPRRDGLFVPVNCAELSSDAVESRLFGHRKGSFTGATEDHKGFFEGADRGTLFLDEIGELGTHVQAKLLRVLQEGEITRFGDARPRRVDVRVVVATNRSLTEEVKAGRFREDLFYRVNVVKLRIPPLRERQEDVIPLVGHFSTLHARRLRVPEPEWTREALSALAAHDFPGNVRDLENTIIRTMVLTYPGELIRASDLLGVVPVEDELLASDGGAGEPGLLAAVARFERVLIEEALAAAGGNRARAARTLGISRRWLLKKLERYGATSNGEGSAKAEEATGRTTDPGTAPP